MELNEYKKQQEEIIKKYGQPEHEMAEPINESARLLRELKKQQAKEVFEAKKAAAKELGQKQAPEGLVAIEKAIPPALKQEYESVSLYGREIPEEYLSKFKEKEKDVLRAHYMDDRLSHTQLAHKFGMSRQQVTALLKSGEARLLESRMFNQEAPSECMKSLLKAIKAGDSKTVIEVSRHFGVLRNEKLELSVQKPIQDPEAQRLLRELGDRMASNTNTSPLEEETH